MQNFAKCADQKTEILEINNKKKALNVSNANKNGFSSPM